MLALIPNPPSGALHAPDADVNHGSQVGPTKLHRTDSETSHPSLPVELALRRRAVRCGLRRRAAVRLVLSAVGWTNRHGGEISAVRLVITKRTLRLALCWRRAAAADRRVARHASRAAGPILANTHNMTYQAPCRFYVLHHKVVIV